MHDFVISPAVKLTSKNGLQTMMCAGLYTNHRADFEQHAWRMSPLLCSLFERGRSISMLELAASCCAADDYQAHLQRLFSSHDVVLTLAAPGRAPAFEYAAGTGSSVFCSLWSLCGLPAVSVPVATSAHGLPLGVQLVGALDADYALLDCVENVAELCIAGDQGSVIRHECAQAAQRNGARQWGRELTRSRCVVIGQCLCTGSWSTRACMYLRTGGRSHKRLPFSAVARPKMSCGAHLPLSRAYRPP